MVVLTLHHVESSYMQWHTWLHISASASEISRNATFLGYTLEKKIHFEAKQKFQWHCFSEQVNNRIYGQQCH